MAHLIKMPKMSDMMTEGLLAKWHKKVGDKVISGDVLAEIETDKATMDFESFWDGFVLFIGVDEGEVVPVDSIVAIIGSQGEDYRTLIAISERYSHDLNYFFNADNIPNQELVFDTFTFFDKGTGEGFYSPIDFFNLLLWKYDFIKKNIKSPFDVLSNLKNTPVGKIEKHILFAFILKWFGGYPINNLDPQFNTTLKLIEREYHAYFKEEHTYFDEKLQQILNEGPVNGGRIVDLLSERNECVNGKKLLNSLDELIKGNRTIEKQMLVPDFFDKKEKIPALITKASDPFIFISHSSKDKRIVGSFIDKVLKLCLKIETNQIFFTSFEESTIESGIDFRNAIKENLIKASLVVLIITDNYKDSEVCLNEMGAAWVLNAKVIPFIVHPIKYDSVGFIHHPNQLLKFNKKSDILKFIDEQKNESNNIKHTEVERHVNDFIDNVNDQIKSSTEIKIKAPQSPSRSDIGLEENDIVLIENRDDLFLFESGGLTHIADNGEFSLCVYGFDKKNRKTIRYLEAKSLINKDKHIPVLHSCEIIIDKGNSKKWLKVNEERRFLPDSVYTILVRNDPKPLITFLDHKEVMEIEEGDKLKDVTNRFA